MPTSPDAIDRADLARRLRDAAHRVAHETVPFHGLATAPPATRPPPARRLPPEVGTPPGPDPVAWSAPAAVRPPTPIASRAEAPPRFAPPSDAANFTVGSDSWQDAVEGLREPTL